MTKKDEINIELSTTYTRMNKHDKTVYLYGAGVAILWCIFLIMTVYAFDHRAYVNGINAYGAGHLVYGCEILLDQPLKNVTQPCPPCSWSGSPGVYNKPYGGYDTLNETIS